MRDQHVRVELLDVAGVFERHGYPRPDGTDWADLELTLFRFLYRER